MPQYLMISTFKPKDGRRENADDLQKRSDAVTREFKSQIPNLKHGYSYALMDRYETIDLFEVDSDADIEKAAEIVRLHGKAQVVVTPVMPWRNLLKRLKQPLGASPPS
jgi:uncharacterized protein with GYD domain